MYQNIRGLGLYKGGLKDGAPHGRGCYTDSAGNRFVGHFVDGKKEGKGKMFFKSGEFYFGEWKEDFQEGHGEFYYLDNSRYVGEFVKGVAHGKGVVYYANLSVYQGEFQHGNKHGKGERTTHRNRVIKETWEDGKLVDCVPVLKKNEMKKGFDVDVLKRKKSNGSDDEQVVTNFIENFEAQLKLVKAVSKKETTNENQKLLTEVETKQTNISRRHTDETQNRKRFCLGKKSRVDAPVISRIREKVEEIEFAKTKKPAKESSVSFEVSGLMSENPNAGPATLSMIEFEDAIHFLRNPRGKFNIKRWTCYEVSSLLRKIGMEKHVKTFSDNKIRGSSLLKLADEDLKEMGVTSVGELIMLRDLLSKLNAIDKEEKKKNMINRRFSKQKIEEEEREQENSSIEKDAAIKSGYPSIDEQRNANIWAERIQKTAVVKDSRASFRRNKSEDFSETRLRVSFKIKSCLELGKAQQKESQDFSESESVKEASNFCNVTISSHNSLSLSEKQETSSSDEDKPNEKHDNLRFNDIETIPNEVKQYFMVKQDLETIEKIGTGAYGEVFRGRYIHTDVAIKVYEKSKMNRQSRKNFLKEVEILGSLRSPNIVLFMGFYVTYKSYFVVTEYMEQGSLYDIVHRKKASLDIIQKLGIIEGIAHGMCHLHDRKLLHCDLKSSNILLGDNYKQVKLCDFGLATVTSKISASDKANVHASHWMAPEVLRREKYEEGSDVYSFGIILWELFTETLPFSQLSPQQLVGSVGYDPDFSIDVGKFLKVDRSLVKLINQCLHREPGERPSFVAIVEKITQVKSEFEKSNQFMSKLENFFTD